MKKNYLILLLMAVLVFPFVACSDDDNNTSGGGDKSPYDPNKPLVVNNLGPLTGGLGTRVVVSGSNFGNDKSKVKLLFNKKEAVIIDVNNTTIYAMVPKQPGNKSVITVKVETGKDASGEPVYRESVLEGKEFTYIIKAAVTTVAGVFSENKEMKDGPALESTFKRLVMCDADSDGNVMLVDDNGGSGSNGAVRLFSVKDNQVKTLLKGINEPWQGSFNEQETEYYAIVRRSSQRPLVAYKFTKASNWVESSPVYSQNGPDGKSLVGTYDFYGLTADDKYIYLLSVYGYRLLRVDQVTGKMELIGEDFGVADWTHMAFNPVDRKLYFSAEGWGKIYRVDPYKEGMITSVDVEHVAGLGNGSPIEGNGLSARMGTIEGLDCDKEGNLYIADYGNNVVWKMDMELNLTVFAGVPGNGYLDGHPTKEAKFNRIYDVAVDGDGLVYVADVWNYVLRCIAVQ